MLHHSVQEEHWVWCLLLHIEAIMKAQLLAIAVLVTIFCGVSHADSCAAGLFSSLQGTTCTIGNMTFAFSDRSGDGNVTPSILTFTPLVTSASAGFEISGLPAASQVNLSH